MRAICRQVGEEKSASCWKVLLDLKCLSVTYRLTFWNAKCNSSTYTARAADSSTTDVWWRRVQLQELDILVRSLPSRRVDNEKAKCEKWNFPSFSSSLSSRFTFSFSSHRVINLNIHSFWLSMSSLNAKFTWATTELCSLHYYCRARKLDMCAALLLALSSNSWWAFFCSIACDLVKMNGIESRNEERCVSLHLLYCKLWNDFSTPRRSCVLFFFPSSRTTHDEVINYWANNAGRRWEHKNTSQWLAPALWTVKK